MGFKKNGYDLSWSLQLLAVGCELLLFCIYTSEAIGCPHGRVKLRGGQNSREGRVEICLHGAWNTVCDDGDWNSYSAGIVCQQLGFSRQGAVAFYQAAFGQGIGSILDEIYCSYSGSEKELIECDIYDWPDASHYDYCTHAQDVGVRCLPCQTGDLRLRGGISEHTGRVEICVNGVWGTVCDDSWHPQDSTVVCKQLGYSRFGSSAYRRASYGPGGGPIHLDNVHCTGNEQRLIDCPYTNNTLGLDCTHDEDASVDCRPTLRCQRGDLKLSDSSGLTMTERMVEVCVDEVWNRVCAGSSWGQEEATVACRELGYSKGDAIAQLGTAGRGYTSGAACSGSEAKLTNCWHFGPTSTICYLNAGIRCGIETLSMPTSLQIIVNESNVCTMTWQPPANLTVGHGTISHYIASCSSEKFGQEESENSTQMFQMFTLQPYLVYECCVLGVNQVGLGNSSCQTIITNEAAPTGPPNAVKVHPLNSTSLFLSWRPPTPEHRNGVIRYYVVELTEANASTAIEYTTEDPHLLIDRLEPDVVYSCGVAAITVEKGPLSESSIIVLENVNLADPDEDLDIQGSRSRINPCLVSTSSLLAIVVLASATCLLVQLCCYKLSTKRRQSRNCPEATSRVYETFEAPTTKEVEKETSNSYSKIAVRDRRTGHRDPQTPSIPPKGLGCSLSSPREKIDSVRNIQLRDLASQSRSAKATAVADSENTYQPLVPPRLQDGAAESYQSLTELTQGQAQREDTDLSYDEDCYCTMDNTA